MTRKLKSARSRENTACFGAGYCQLTFALLLSSLQEPRRKQEAGKAADSASSCPLQECGGGLGEWGQKSAFYSALWEVMRVKEGGGTLLGSPPHLTPTPDFLLLWCKKEGLTQATLNRALSRLASL